MASNFSCVYGIGETVQFKSTLKSDLFLEGEIIAVVFYEGLTSYKILVGQDVRKEYVTEVPQSLVGLVQKPLRERLIKKLSTMTDEEAEVEFAAFNGKETTDGKATEV